MKFEESYIWPERINSCMKKSLNYIKMLRNLSNIKSNVLVLWDAVGWVVTRIYLKIKLLFYWQFKQLLLSFNITQVLGTLMFFKIQMLLIILWETSLWLSLSFMSLLSPMMYVYSSCFYVLICIKFLISSLLSALYESFTYFRFILMKLALYI